MEKIKGFQISSMTVSGFKCYEAPMEITFGNPTIITGGNGRGPAEKMVEKVAVNAFRVIRLEKTR